MMGDMNRDGRHAGRFMGGRSLLAAGVVLLAGCGAGSGSPPGSTPIKPLGAATATSATAPTTPTGPTTGPPTAPTGAATSPAPTSAPPVTITANSAGRAPTRNAPTTDLLPPPADGQFHATVQAVPLAVLDRSTWSFGCPVMPDDLRYVTVSFKGFDGRAHTGELLVNRSAAKGVASVFRKLFAAGWPIEGMRIVTAADLSGPSTGDVNNTSAFTCRAVTGSKTTWSQHAYGLALDLNPFQNPYLAGSRIIPGSAGAYRDRTPSRPGLNTPGSLPVRAFRALGWGWGGTYTSKKDYMHFSATGG